MFSSVPRYASGEQGPMPRERINSPPLRGEAGPDRGPATWDASFRVVTVKQPQNGCPSPALLAATLPPGTAGGAGGWWV